MFSSGAYAACVFYTVTKQGRLKAPFTLNRSEAGVEYYQAQSGGFVAMVEFERRPRILKGRVVSSAGDMFTVDLNGANLVDELDCFSGWVRQNRFEIRCESPQWKDLREREGLRKQCD